MTQFFGGGVWKAGSRLVRAAGLFAFMLLGVLVGLGVGGCGRSHAPADNPEAGHIKNVAALIHEFATAHQGNSPANLDQLKSWALQNGKADDKDFLSTRDQEPYVMAANSKKGSKPIIHEAQGKNGMKFMVNTGSGLTSEISDQGLEYMTGQSFKSARQGGTRK
jgi:hypothetical protein